MTTLKRLVGFAILFSFLAPVAVVAQPDDITVSAQPDDLFTPLAVLGICATWQRSGPWQWAASMASCGVTDGPAYIASAGTDVSCYCTILNTTPIAGTVDTATCTVFMPLVYSVGILNEGSQQFNLVGQISSTSGASLPGNPELQEVTTCYNVTWVSGDLGSTLC